MNNGSMKRLVVLSIVSLLLLSFTGGSLHIWNTGVEEPTDARCTDGLNDIWTESAIKLWNRNDDHKVLNKEKNTIRSDQIHNFVQMSIYTLISEEGISKHMKSFSVDRGGNGEVGDDFTGNFEPQEANQPPKKPSDPNPKNNSSSVPLNTTLSVNVSDPDGDDMVVTFYNANNDDKIGSVNVSNNETAFVEWSGLKEDIEYSWYVMADDSLNTLRSETWTFFTKDVTAPLVEDSIPKQDDNKASVSRDIFINFSEPMDKKSVEQNISSYPEIKGAISWYQKDTVMRYVLAENLSSDTSYYINISNTAQDKNGVNMASDFNLSFKTLNKRPGLNIHTPKKNRSYGGSECIEINWTAEDDHELPAEASSIWISSDGGENWSLIAEDVTRRSQYKWYPAKLSNRTRIMINCTDSIGQTTSKITGNFSIVDETTPSIMYKWPPENTTGIHPEDQIVIEFDEPIKDCNVNIYSASDDQIISGVPLIGRDGKSVEVLRTAELKNQTTYRIEVEAWDENDNIVTERWSFTTGGTVEEDHWLLPYFWIISILAFVLISAFLYLIQRRKRTNSSEQKSEEK